MKKPSREINIFSMSALDLFASAMGAFILITIILLPYFPNTHQTPPTPPIRSADVVIAFDTTGSMKDKINGIKRDMSSFLKIMLEIVPDFYLGFIDFKDRCESIPLRTFSLDSASRQPQSMIDFINEAQTGGNCNPDLEEAVAEALEKAVRSNWRKGSERRIVILMTDNPAYDDKKDSMIEQARSFKNRSREKNYVSVVFVDTGGSTADARSFLRKVSEAGGGDFVDSDDSITVQVLKILLRK